jgi:hypothetical protein
MTTTPASQEHPIRRARLGRGWSQQDLGEKLTPPVGKGAVSQWEADLTQPLPAYGLQLVDLFGGEFTLEDLYRRSKEAA